MAITISSSGITYSDGKAQTTGGGIRGVITGFYDFASGYTTNLGGGEDTYYKDITISACYNPVIYIQNHTFDYGTSGGRYNAITGRLINSTTLRLSTRVINSTIKPRCRYYIVDGMKY